MDSVGGMRERLDDLQKKVRGLESLEKRGKARKRVAGTALEAEAHGGRVDEQPRRRAWPVRAKPRATKSARLDAERPARKAA